MTRKTHGDHVPPTFWLALLIVCVVQFFAKLR